MSIIQVSQAAIQEILRLRSQTAQLKSLPAETELRFRLSTAVKGCLPRSYVIEFDDQIKPADHVIPLATTLQCVVQASELPYVAGVAIDYAEDLMGGGFRFHNPHAAQICSCGNSFLVKE